MKLIILLLLQPAIASTDGIEDIRTRIAMKRYFSNQTQVIRKAILELNNDIEYLEDYIRKQKRAARNMDVNDPNRGRLLAEIENNKEVLNVVEETMLDVRSGKIILPQAFAFDNLHIDDIGTFEVSDRIKADGHDATTNNDFVVEEIIDSTNFILRVISRTIRNRETIAITSVPVWVGKTPTGNLSLGAFYRPSGHYRIMSVRQVQTKSPLYCFEPCDIELLRHMYLTKVDR